MKPNGRDEFWVDILAILYGIATAILFTLLFMGASDLKSVHMHFSYEHTEGNRIETEDHFNSKVECLDILNTYMAIAANQGGKNFSWGCN